MKLSHSFVVFVSGWLSTGSVLFAAQPRHLEDETYVRMGCSNSSVLVNRSNSTGIPVSNLVGSSYRRYNNSRHACMCSFLEDKQLANTKMKSIRKVTKCVNGVAITPEARYPCSKVNLMALVSLQELDAIDGTSTDSTNDVWGWTDPDTCAEIAILGMASGTAFVDITDPSNYQYLGKLPFHDVASDWRGIKTYKNHAFIISESVNHGMQIFDLTQLTTLTQNGNIFAETNHFGGFGKAHTLFINEDTGIAFVAGSDKCDGGLYMVDITTPSSPKYAGCFSRDGYTHEPQCVVYHGSDTRYQGREICFACNEDSVTIVDVSKKQRPLQLSKTTYTNTVYTHQGWLTDDHNNFIFGDEFDEESYSSKTRTLVLNLGSNLQRPVVGGVFYSQLMATDHNQYVLGSRVFQANYQAGLRILRINRASAANFTEIAYFDTYPSGNSYELNGAWSNYPYFPSGTVVLSGIEHGLFVLQPTLPRQTAICPASAVCDTDLVAKNCGGLAKRYTMNRLFLGACISDCFVRSEVAVKKKNGWACGPCKRGRL